uniref:Uncharacterized protein n=1 Tax=Anguilla anguilla TaxID=7936 RepID=A0A0E9W9E7_ANGAN
MNSGTLCRLCCFSLKTDKTAVLPVSVNLTFLASGVVSFPHRLTAVCAPDCGCVQSQRNWKSSIFCGDFMWMWPASPRALSLRYI